MGGGVPMSLVWISKPVVSLIEEETMLLSIFFFSAFLCQGHVACQNFTLTGPNAGKLHAYTAETIRIFWSQ